MELTIIRDVVSGLKLDKDEDNLNIVIPEGVIAIGDKAFKNKPVAAVTFPSSLLRVGNNAFYKTKLTSVEIPDSVTYIGAHAFAECKLLKSVKLPQGITQVACSLFAGCGSLEKINFPSGLLEIKEMAFCSTNLKTVDLSGTKIHTIQKYGFYNCGVEELKLPEMLKELGESAFENCSNLSKAEIPCGVEVLSESLFSNCVNIKQLKLNEGLKKIRSRALPPNLSDIEFPESLEEFDQRRMEFVQLYKLNLPKNINIVCDYSLVSVYSPPICTSNPHLIEENGCFLSADKTVLLAVPDVPVVKIPNGPECINLALHKSTNIREIYICETAKIITLNKNDSIDAFPAIERVVIQGKPVSVSFVKISINEVVFSPDCTGDINGFMFGYFFSCSGTLKKVYSNALRFILKKDSGALSMQTNKACITAFFEGGYPYNSETIKFVKWWIASADSLIMLGLGAENMRHIIESKLMSVEEAKRILPETTDVEIRQMLIDYISGEGDDLSL